MKDFVPYELAVKLKDKGFREECLCHYIGNDLFYNIESPIANKQLWFSHNKYDNIWHRDNYDAPTISQVLKWLRTEHKIYMYVERDTYHLMFRFVFEKDKPRGKFTSSVYDNFEQAATAGIEYVLDNLI